MSDFVMGAALARQPAAASPANRRLVALWLFAVCGMIWIMVGIGGYTRDSGSGLSIMDWRPISGIVPPLSGAAWNRVFALYRTIPQYHLEHQGMDLAGFQSLYWPEYVHRLWGRLIGLVFFLPLLAFIATGRIERRLVPWLGLLFLLGGLQGTIGWFMVASGFDPNSVAVQPWRLSLHFCAAMFLYVAVLWTGATVLRPTAPPVAGLRGLRRWTLLATACLAVTMFAGTFVSGTHAIDVYNAQTHAGMGAPPPDYFALTPRWLNLFANKAAVLFDHQALASLTTIAILATATIALRKAAPGPVRDAGLAIAGLVLLQFILGISALVSKLIDLGVAHQLNAVLLLSACLWLLHNLRGATR